MDYLRRKIDSFLLDWKARIHLPLLVKGARQVGKTESIIHFGKTNYSSLVYVNFVEKPKFKTIVSGGYDAESIVRELTNLDPSFHFKPNDTLIVFDEIQEFPDIATSLKFFKIDGRFDVIVSGSLLGVHYKKIASLAVGYQEDFEMRSMDFEEFLWARGRGDDFTDMIFGRMQSLKPFTDSEAFACGEHFREYCILGGMPGVVSLFVEQGNYQGTLDRQRWIMAYYRADIRKYCDGLDQARVVETFDAIPALLGRENRKFQYAAVRRGAKARDYAGCIQWLEDAGLVARAFNMRFPELPIKGNLDSSAFKAYLPDTGLLLASLDDEVVDDFKANRNIHTYKGGIVENLVAEAILKTGKPLCYFKKENATLEMDFFLRTSGNLVPVEVKATNGRSKTLSTLIKGEHYPDITYGVKLTGGNIGFENGIYTFPHFCAFLLPRFLTELQRP
jgi:predicted AAA+ superfamily ATPase